MFKRIFEVFYGIFMLNIVVFATTETNLPQDISSEISISVDSKAEKTVNE